jgi:hypothetical protein
MDSRHQGLEERRLRRYQGSAVTVSAERPDRNGAAPPREQSTRSSGLAMPGRLTLAYESLGPQGAARRRSGGAIVQPAAFDHVNVPRAVYHRIRILGATLRL